MLLILCILSVYQACFDFLKCLELWEVLYLFLTCQSSSILHTGKPNASMYFVGMQDEYVFYLDPHLVQPVVNVDKDNFDTSSYRTMYPQKMLCKEMDPCLAIGFLCSSLKEFDDLCYRLKVLELQNPNFHVISVAEGRDPCHRDGAADDKDPLSHVYFE